MSRLTEAGILLLGLAAIAIGLRTIHRREMVATDEIGMVIATYRGIAAVCQGLSEVVVGLMIVAFATAGLIGATPTLVALLRHRPGIAVLGAAAAGLPWSLSILIGAVEERGTTWRLVASALGLFLVLTCLVAFGVGVWEILDPAGFDRLLRLLSSVVPTDMPHH